MKLDQFGVVWYSHDGKRLESFTVYRPFSPIFLNPGYIKIPRIFAFGLFVDTLSNVFCNKITSHYFNSGLGEIKCSASHVMYFMPTDDNTKLLYKWEKTFLMNIYVYLYGWETLWKGHCTVSTWAGLYLLTKKILVSLTYSKNILIFHYVGQQSNERCILQSMWRVQVQAFSVHQYL